MREDLTQSGEVFDIQPMEKKMKKVLIVSFLGALTFGVIGTGATQAVASTSSASASTCDDYRAGQARYMYQVQHYTIPQLMSVFGVDRKRIEIWVLVCPT